MLHSRSASVEEYSTDNAFVAPKACHSPSSPSSFLSSYISPLQVRKAHKSAKLSLRSRPTFPIPTGEAHTPRDQTCRDIDTLPFPLQPSAINDVKPDRKPADQGAPPSRCFNSGTQCWTPPSSPDRFIPRRDLPANTTQKFRVGKSTNSLSSNEKILRQSSASPDPFTPRNSGPVRHSHRRNAGRDGSPLRPAIISVADPAAPRNNSLAIQNRNVSIGAVWNVGGAATTPPGPITGVSNGRGGMHGSGTNAPMYSSRFFTNQTSVQDSDRFEGRLALACGIDQANRVLSIAQSSALSNGVTQKLAGSKRKKSPPNVERTAWIDGRWSRGDLLPFLDAPQLRDDYYCSLLAYCYTSRTLAVGLNNRVYLWSESYGVRYPRMEDGRRNSNVTSLSFSSTDGGHSILAIGRSDGQICLWSLNDEETRFHAQQPHAVACVSFKPVTTRRQSQRFGRQVMTEELLVGDELGSVYYYSVEWMSRAQFELHGWSGSMTLMAKISVHTQQICGLAWSQNGEFFATGGNDNACCLFEAGNLLTPQEIPSAIDLIPTLRAGLDLSNSREAHPSLPPMASVLGSQRHNLPRPGGVLNFAPAYGDTFTTTVTPGQGGVLQLTDGRQRHKWQHSAAVKAIAFCPWQSGLLATGGGSNDRAIHFFHMFSGACLATIDVQAQVTSLVWSTMRREIAATFGYAQPDHAYRIAVFSWPDCRQIVAIPWLGDMRALYAIPYPGGPNETEAGRHRNGEGGTWWSRTAEEGCIVVASSDESVKFHEVWSEAKRSSGGGQGLLGGSDILEGLEGIDKDGGEVIR